MDTKKKTQIRNIVTKYKKRSSNVSIENQKDINIDIKNTNNSKLKQTNQESE